MNQKKPSIRLFVEASLSIDAGIVLDKAQAHYVGNVMRKEVGEPVVLFNGRDGEWIGELQDVRKANALVHVKSCLRLQSEELDIDLLFAPLKKIPTALVIQKATELGVSRICPVQTTRTNADKFREDKMVLQAVEAAEQSERLSVPIISKLQKLMPALEALENDRSVIFCNERLDQRNAVSVLSGLPKQGKWAVLIGPEGGFTTEEIDLLSKRENVYTISLGPRVLRAETAVISALTLLQSINGDWA